MSSDNTGVQELSFVDHAGAGTSAWGDHPSQAAASSYDPTSADQSGANSQSWLFFDPMFGASPNQQATQGGLYADESSKLPFTLGGPEVGDAFGSNRRVADQGNVKADPTLDSIFTPSGCYAGTDRRAADRPAASHSNTSARKCERRRPRRTASSTANSASNRSFSPGWSSRRTVGNKSFSNSLNRFTHPDENGKRKIRNEIMSIAESLPALPGLYFDKKQKGFRVRYQNVYVGWVALSRFASIEEAYISAREIWESAKCHAEKFQTPHAAVMASYPLQKEAQASGKNRGGRPRTVTQLPPDPTNWLNTAFLAHQSSATVPLTTPWGDAPAEVPPLGYQTEAHGKRRCRSPPQQAYWPPWPADNFVLAGGDGAGHDHRDANDLNPELGPDNFWTQQGFGMPTNPLKASSDPPASFAGFSQNPQYHLGDCILEQPRDYRPLCHLGPPGPELDGYEDSGRPNPEYCGLAPFPGAAELPGAISFSQPVAEESFPDPIVKRESPSPARPSNDSPAAATTAAPPPSRKKRRRDEDSSPSGDEDPHVSQPPTKRRWPPLKNEGGGGGSPLPSSDVSTAVPPPSSPPAVN